MVGKVIFLVDTNIWLELLLEQEKSEDVKELNCRIVSFDSDFDKTEMGRLSPKQAIELL